MINSHYIARTRTLLVEMILAIIAGTVTLGFYGSLNYQSYTYALIVASIILIPFEIVRQAGGWSTVSKKAMIVLENLSGSLVRYEELLEQNKLFSMLKYNRSLNQELLAQMRDLNKGLSHFAKLSELFEEMNYTSQKIRNEQRDLLSGLLNRLEGIAALSQQLREQKKESYLQSERLLFETLIPSLRGKAEALLALNNYQEALSTYEEARRIAEQFPPKQIDFAQAIIEMTRIYMSMAQVFLALNRADDAIQAYNKAIQISGHRRIKGG